MGIRSPCVDKGGLRLTDPFLRHQPALLSPAITLLYQVSPHTEGQLHHAFQIPDSIIDPPWRPLFMH